MKRITVSGTLPENFEQAFAQLSQELGMELAREAYPVTLERGECLELEMAPDYAALRWSKPVECWRGLSLLSQHWGETFRTRQAAAFPVLGVMFDVSRNAVLRPESMRFFLRKMALMGFDLGMMYTEDTYEVPEYPYFGYLRGRYSQEELRELDDYAACFGIELCPCIQTLGHLNRALHWPAMEHMKDTEEVLLVGEEDSYRFIRAMLKNASAPYRSRRIHIGMDEAHFLGQGAYLRRHGYTHPFRIMREHLQRVSDIVRELGLEAMMWSDMYFRPSSPTGAYYDCEEISPEAAACASPDIPLVYWDYYHEDEAVYDRMFRLHEALGVPVYFASGVWTWTGPAPDMDKTLAASLPGLRQARAHGAQLVLAAAWGDNGAETNLLTTLYALQVYAEFDYTGAYEEEKTAARFRAVVGADARAFLDLTRFNALPGVKNWSVRPVNASKFLLYQDPLVPLFDADLAGVDASAHYSGLAALYERYREENPEFAQLFGFYCQLGKALAVKCRWHQLAGPCVRAGNREGAAVCVKTAREAADELERLRLEWLALWERTNKPYGFEILDLRLGGLIARMRTAAATMDRFARGELETVPSLAEMPLPYTRLPDGALKGSYAWGEIVSACKIDL